MTQRGNRRQQGFFGPEDYEAYREALAEGCRKSRVSVWGYCMMPNHVHLILTPQDEDGLRAALGEVHRRYTRLVNFREGWRDYLWQGRFGSFPMDERYHLACARYVALNPVSAGLIARPEAWRWSSAAAHLTQRDDASIEIAPLHRLVPDWRTFLAAGLGETERADIRAHERTGRPLGAERFVRSLEPRLRRPLARAKPGPKPKERGEGRR